jgi:hypothetical protein
MNLASLVKPLQSNNEKYQDIPIGYKTNIPVRIEHGKTNK